VINDAAAAAPVTVVLTEAGLRREGTADAIVATLARAAVLLLAGQMRRESASARIRPARACSPTPPGHGGGAR
jgi:hypothetical protein